MRAVHVQITGRVQGVGYRAWCRRVALNFELTGWVRNRADGSVEAVVCGPIYQVDAMLIRCKEGPAGSRVDEVLELGEVKPVEEGFQILPTA